MGTFVSVEIRPSNLTGGENKLLHNSTLTQKLKVSLPYHCYSVESEGQVNSINLALAFTLALSIMKVDFVPGKNGLPMNECHLNIQNAKCLNSRIRE
jgi:hypothetical protein